MKRYEAYKDSGVEWIGEIPEGWKTNRMKFLFSFGRGLNITKADLTEVGIPVISYGQIHSKQNTGTAVQDCLLRYVSAQVAENHQECKTKVGDFIFADTSEDKDGCGNCVYIDRDGIFAGYHAIVLDGKGQDNKYFSYLFKSDEWRSQIRSKASGVKVFSITQSIMSDCSLLIPSKEEQRAIAAYLDHKVGKINASVSAIDKQIDDLKAYRQSIISEAVTKGLNPNAKMKDSGVEWIGEVPEGWNELRLRFVCELRNGYTPSKAIPEFWENGSIPWYRMDDIRDSGRRLNKAKQYVTKEAVKGGGLFEAGSFILATTATIGEHAVLIVDSLANQRFTNLKIRKSLEAKLLRNFFFYYLFVIDDYCKSTTNTSTFPAVNMELLKDCLVVFPSVEEQQNIADYLDQKCNQIASAIASLEQQKEDLKALKQSVISEAVTGKIDVREWNEQNEEQ